MPAEAKFDEKINSAIQVYVAYKKKNLLILSLTPKE